MCKAIFNIAFIITVNRKKYFQMLYLKSCKCKNYNFINFPIDRSFIIDFGSKFMD